MRKIHVAAGASVGVVALVASSLAASAAPVDDTDVSSTDQTAQTEGGEFVVAYEGDAAAATEAVAAAGGTVVDVNEAVGIALVEAPDGAFAAEADGHRRRDGRGPQPLGRHRPARASSTASSRSGRRPPTGAARPARAPRAGSNRGAPGGPSRSPTASGTWRMIGTSTGAHRRATGRGVDRRHHRHRRRRAATPTSPRTSTPSCRRNFTMDIPAIDGPCEVADLHRPGRRRRRRSRHPRRRHRRRRRQRHRHRRASPPTPRSSTSAPARTRATSSSTRRSPPSPTRATPGSTWST